MKTVKKIINTVMGAFVGVFIGHSAYVIWNCKKQPELYVMQSAPWYTSILVYGGFTLVVLVIGIWIKFILKYFTKRTIE